MKSKFKNAVASGMVVTQISLLYTHKSRLDASSHSNIKSVFPIAKGDITIAGYWAVQALQNFVTNTASAMAEVGKTAGYLGIAADALQELRYAA